MVESTNLNFHSFEELSSTSTTIHELLAAGECPPLAVFAESQTSGRGRRGHSWQSPKGNIYLSLALPAGELSIQRVGWLPLQMASIICSWIDKTFGLRATIKWPNDILIDGKKLCGILCESALQGSELTHVIIGCGLNVNHAPKLSKSEQLTTSLNEQLNSVFEPKKLARELASEILNACQNGDPETTLERFNKYSLSESQPFIDSKDKSAMSLLLYDRVDHQGRLLMRKPGGALLPPISSVHHDYRWWYLDQKPLVVADIGNTRSKLYLFSTPRAQSVSKRWALPNTSNEWHAALEALREELTSLGVSEKLRYPLHIAAVGNALGLNQEAWASSINFEVLGLIKRPVRYRGGYNLEEIGIDRLALIEGYLARKSKKTGLLISSGTAVTIDAVCPDGIHLGGWIMPGLQLSFDALAKNTTLLPQVNFEDIDVARLLGATPQGTHDAITCGVLAPVVAMIEKQAQLLTKKYCHEPEIIVTGGASTPIFEALPSFVDESLIASGLRNMVIAGG